MELFKTKLEPALEFGELIARPRLLQKLEEAVQTRLTLLQAPAGYGKTRLLTQWFHALRASRSRVAWLSVDEPEQDSARFLAYLSTGIAAAGIRMDSAGSAAPDQALTTLVNTLEPESQSLYLFVDGVHLLAPAPLAMLCRFIDHAPATVRFILASRVIPEMPLARMRARGQLLELGVDDLKFTAAEAQQFIANAGEHELIAPDLAALQARTEGWVTGIKLACGMLRQGAPDHVVGTSKTFRQLARIAGAAPYGAGPYAKRVLKHADVADLAKRLPTMTTAERARLPGVSASRTPQLPAGAIVADAILDLLGVDQLELCPWALREGVILRRLDRLAQGLSAVT